MVVPGVSTTVQPAINSAVARGGARGACAPPSFFLKVQTDLYEVLKIKYYLSRGLRQ